MRNLISPIIWMAVVLALIGTLFVIMQAKSVSASAPPGLQATIATSSTYAIGATTASTLIATTSCAATIITTNNSAIMLTFSDYAGQSPTGSFGHAQAASTTVAYDSGQYGCGKVKAYSYAAQKLTITRSN